MFKKVGICGDWFIAHLEAFIGVESQRDPAISEDLGLENIYLSWHGVGGRTVKKIIDFDLPALEAANLDGIIVQIGSNDLCSPSVSPSGLIDQIQNELLPHLHKLGIQVVYFCQVFHRRPGRTLNQLPIPLHIYNDKVTEFNHMLASLAQDHFLAQFWEHQSLLKCGKINRVWRADGIHLNWHHGQKPFYRSIRGAAIQVRDLLSY